MFRNVTHKSKVSCEKYFVPDDFNKYSIDSVMALKQVPTNNSSDNGANLLSNSSYVDSNFKLSHTYF